MVRKITTIMVDPDEWEVFVKKYKSASAKIREWIHRDLEES